MKKIFTFAASALMATASWAGVITLDMNKPLNPATIEYGDNNVWTECYNDVDYSWLEFGGESGEFMLSHLIAGEGMSWGGYYWDGFTPAIGGDQTDYGQAGSSAGWTVNYGGCMAGGGCVINADGTVTADPSVPYFVAYVADFWGFPTNEVKYIDKDGNETFEPVGVYVCNHPWPYYGCVHGDGFGTGFEEGDYFELTAVGVAADGSEKRVSINLIDYTDGQLNALNDWTFFDLSGLGEVTSVYFTLASTDMGDYGMNTAAYFCMDKFQVKGEETPVDPTQQGYWMVLIDQFGIEHEPIQLNEGADGDYTTTYTFEYYPWGEFAWNPNLTDEQNEANRPNVPFYFIIDGVRYGADTDRRATYLGDAMENPLGTEDNEWNGCYTVPVGFSYTLGVAKDNQDNYYVYAAVAKRTDVEELNANKAVAGVRYFNMAGQEMQQAEGMTIVVTTYTDGTTSTAKVIK